jgi:SET domain-containing protein
MEYYHKSNFNLYLKESQLKNSGFGVFTNNFIPANTYIDEYFGDHMSITGGSYVLKISTNNYIDAFNFPRCYMAMLNDASYVPKKIIKKKNKRINITPDGNYIDNILLVNNCKFVYENNRGYVYSINDIYPNEELFISYGTDYWN